MCDKASGGLYPAVNNSDVLSYVIHIPDIQLSQKISVIYQQADKSEFELRKSIEAIDQVIKSLINDIK
jgi:type I restriction enzyme S subunit